MDAALEYLHSFLQDEFRDTPGVRIRLVQPAGTVRSPDLEQDYDPEASSVHLRRGVIVMVQSREYYFPSDWVTQRRYSEISSLAAEIRGALD